MKSYLGLDLGSKTCGVALSDGLGMFAHPLTTLYFDGDYQDLFEDLEEIVRENKVHAIALGLPKMMNNDIGERAQITLDFKKDFEAYCGCEIHLIDERLTTVHATRQLISQDMSRKKRKEVIDQLAAVHILQTYLDQLKYRKENLNE